MIFFSLSLHIVFRLPSWPFCLSSSLFSHYLTLLLPLFSFSFPSSIFCTLSSFFSCHFILFPQMTSADIPSPWDFFPPIYTPLQPYMRKKKCWVCELSISSVVLAGDQNKLSWLEEDKKNGNLKRSNQPRLISWGGSSISVALTSPRYCR
jgi:hypothetical protein